MQNKIFLLKLFYFFYFGSLACFFPYFNLFLERNGFSGIQIGFIAGIIPLMFVFAAPLWTFISDLFKIQKQLLCVSIIGAIIFFVFIPFVIKTKYLLFFIALFSFFLGPIVPFVDNISMQILKDKQNKYGNIRIWGALGWGIVAPITGLLIKIFTINVIFISFSFIMFICFLLSPYISFQSSIVQKKKIKNSVKKFIQKEWFVFFISILIASIGMTMTARYFLLFLNAKGLSEALFGISLTIATISELPIYFFSNKLLNFFGPKKLILIAFGSFGVRALLYTFITNPIWALPIQLLHGLSFSTLWIASVVYSDNLADHNIKTTAQGILNGVFMGLGGIMGTVLGGVLYDTVGSINIFRISILTVMFSFVFFAILARKQKAKNEICNE